MSTTEISPFTANKRPPIRVGLVGVTGYGGAYLETLQKLVETGRVKWGAVTIVNPDDAVKELRYFEEESVPVYSDYLEMLDESAGSLDWVCIPTGIGFHREMTIESLRRGLQVTVEKPLAPTLQDVAAIQAAERESGIEISVGFQYIYQKETWDIKKRLLEGEIGKVQRVDCIALWPRMRSYYARNRWSGRLHDGNSWILDSPLHNALCHLINLISFWSGDELEKEGNLARMSAETYRAKPIESYDTVRVVAEMESGIEAAVVLSHSTHQRYDPEIHIVGERGKIVWRFIGDYEVEVDGVSTFYPKLCQVDVRDFMFKSILDKMDGKPARICTSELSKGTAKWVNAVHDTAVTQDVPDAYRRALNDESNEYADTIEGLEYYGLRSFRERKSFRELGVPWAAEPYEADLSGYTEFEGKLLPKPVALDGARKLAK